MQRHTHSSRRSFLALSTLAGASVAFPQSAQRRRLKAGQIGAKHAHASGKFATLRKLTRDYDVVGIAEKDPEFRRKVADSGPYKGARWLTEEELLGDASVEVVAIETEVDALVPTAMRAIEAGKHIHLDKPGGTSMSAYRDLREVADAKGLTIQMGYMFRYNPGFEFVMKALREGWLGTISEINASIGKRAGPGLREELAQYAGGGMFELGCHLVDAVVSAVGAPDRVHAVVLRTRPDQDGFADNQLATLEVGHCIATVRCNHLDPFGFPRRMFQVVGANGFIEMGPLEPPQVRMGLKEARGGFAPGIQEVEVGDSSGRYDGEFADLARVARGEKALAWDSKHDLISHETILKASGMRVD